MVAMEEASSPSEEECLSNVVPVDPDLSLLYADPSE